MVIGAVSGTALELRVTCAKNTGAAREFTGQLNRWDTLTIKQKAAQNATLQIDGPESVESGSYCSIYSATVWSSSGVNISSETVSPVWTLAEGGQYASLTSLLTPAGCASLDANSTDVDRTVKIKATYSGLTSTKTVTIKAKSPTTYAVVYKSGSYGSGSQQTATKTKDVALTLKGAIFARTGYTQTGWATSDGGANAYELGAPYTANAAITLYPYWTLNTPTTYTVTYKPGSYGSGSQQTATKTQNVVLTLKGAIFTRTGYTQTGWATSDGGAKAYDLGATYTANIAVTLYPFWTANKYTLTFDANGGKGGWSRAMDYGATIVAPTVTREGYTFAGWSPAVPATVPVGGATYTAQWSKLPDPEPAPGLFEEVDGAVPADAASEYNGYLYDETSGEVKGSIQVKVGKPGKKDGKATACEIALGADGISGFYGACLIDGSRNFFASKDKAEVNAANDVLSKWLGSFMAVWDGGSLGVTIAAKGKVKVSGTLADGKTKVSASTVLLVGEEWSCISVAAPKASLAFTLWLSHDGQTIEAEGLGEDALVGIPGTLPGGAAFRIDADEFAAAFGQALLPYLPDGVPVTQKGAKWTLPKAGKVAYKNGAVDASKLGENPCGLKLTYKAKDGTFKGSFKVYAEVKGKPKATTVKGKPPVAVTIE